MTIHKFKKMIFDNIGAVEVTQEEFNRQERVIDLHIDKIAENAYREAKNHGEQQKHLILSVYKIIS